MAEHSRCQPGRPRPHGVAQEAVSGSPSLCAFQSAKSRGSRLRVVGLGVGGRLQVVELLAGERPVLGKGADVEVHVAVDGVGVPALDQPLHERDHVRARARSRAARTWAAGRRGRRRRGCRPARSRTPRPTTATSCAVGLGQDLVVDVGDVADVGDVETARGQPAPQDVERERGTDVAHVRRPLDGEPADVDGRPTGTQGREVADRTGGRVVQAEAHCGESTESRRTLTPVPRPSPPS